MKKQPDNYLYLLKKVHGWCKRQGMTDPENVFPMHIQGISPEIWYAPH